MHGVFFGKASLEAVGKSTGGSYVNHWQTFDPTGKELALSNKTNAWLFLGNFSEIVVQISKIKSFDWKHAGNTNVAFSAWEPGKIEGVAEIMGKNMLKLIPIPVSEMSELTSFLVTGAASFAKKLAGKQNYVEALKVWKKSEYAVSVYEASLH